MNAYCDQGHPEHDPRVGCGPCQDEEDAGMGERTYALPTAELIFRQWVRS